MCRDARLLDMTQTGLAARDPDLVDPDSRPDPDLYRGPNPLVVQEVLEVPPVLPLGSRSIRP